jgi:hypothetical protein
MGLFDVSCVQVLILLMRCAAPAGGCEGLCLAAEAGPPKPERPVRGGEGGLMC